jgi:hypothetical protein
MTLDKDKTAPETGKVFLSYSPKTETESERRRFLMCCVNVITAFLKTLTTFFPARNGKAG